MLVCMPGIDEITDELYGLPPEEFTAARTRYEKAAKAAGDRDAAARIHALAKPTVTAWLANQLAREHRDELQPLLQLGAGLRDATRNLAGDQLRALSRQRNELVNALVQQARQLARTAGRSVNEDAARALIDTLHAALADEDAAKLLVAGRLTDALHSADFGTGFGDTADGESGANVIPISRKQSGGRRVAGEEERRTAERDLIDAQRALADATAERDDAQTQAADADHAAAAAHERLAELRQQLEEASSAASDADRLRRDQATALERAERALRAAERKNREAQDHHSRV